MAKQSFASLLKNLFTRHKTFGQDFFDDLADSLIEGDVGAKLSMEIVDELQEKCRENKIKDESVVMEMLQEILLRYVHSVSFDLDPAKTNVFIVLGVNGVGKTTSVAKMASWYSRKNLNVVMGACDTFRAAAVDQIIMHGEKLGIRVVHHQMGSDPGAVLFDACDAVSAKNGGLVLADTAGRLHNKENLVNELKKIDKIGTSKTSPECYKKILVLDATTGQNAVRQAEVFKEAVGVDAIILTKYDSTAKGGELITIGKELGIPVLFVCTGEKYPDIDVLDEKKFVKEFLGL